MKVLLDECVPRPLNRNLTGHTVMTVGQMGWSGLKNGTLLQKVREANFDVFVTVDQNIEYQQNTDAIPFALIIVVAVSNRLEALQPFVPQIRDKLKTA